MLSESKSSAWVFCQTLVTTLCTLILASSVVGQQQPWRPTPAKPYVLRGSDRRLLDRAERFLKQEHWEDAIAALMRLLESENSSVVTISEDCFVSVNEYCHRLLASMPAEALARYRALVDAAAESWYRDGIGQRDVTRLQSLLRRYFCSNWGDDALFAIGELALQRGEYQKARNAWLALAGQGGAVAERLCYPDSDLSGAVVDARLVLLAIREGAWQQAEESLQQFQREYPEARGRLGGREVALAEHLAALLQQARLWPPLANSNDWSSFAGNDQRTNPIDALRERDRYELLWSKQIENDTLTVLPIVAGGKVFFRDFAAVTALNLADGVDAFVTRGKTFGSAADSANSRRQVDQTLSVHKHRLYGVTTIRSDAQDDKSRSTLWALDLQREGAIAWEQVNEEPRVLFSGAPIVDGQRVYVSIRSSAQTTRAGIACFDHSTGEQLWLRWLCQSHAPARDSKSAPVRNLLTYDSGILYTNTNLGAIAAVRADEGQVLWLRTYQRQDRPSVQNTYRGPNPCIFHRGVIYALPSDSNAIHALHAGTGESVWTNLVTRPEAQLLGVTADGLLLNENGLWNLSLTDGERKSASQAFAAGVVSDSDRSDVPGLAEANFAVAGPYLVAAEKTELSVFYDHTNRDE